VSDLAARMMQAVESLTAERDALKAEAAKWERLYDAVHYVLIDEIKGDSFGSHEELHETAARVLTERNKLLQLIRAHVNASNNDDTAGDTFGALVSEAGGWAYDEKRGWHAT